MNLPGTLLGEWERTVIEAAKAAASRAKARVYLVGGPVRDLLLEIPLGDLDLVVDDQGERFAGMLADELHMDLAENRRFLTWKLTARTGRHVDLALIRTERYESPGALPGVEAAGTIEEDLHRRDFTINAMAYRLDDGSRIDPLGGGDDLSAGIVRVLHDRSFVDDPTRIFRALRLAARFGFTLAEDTRQLLQNAVAGGGLTTVALERIWKEIDIACGEKMPVPAFQSFIENDCLSTVLGTTPASLEHLPADLTIPSELDARVVLLASLLRGRPSKHALLPYDETTNRRIRAFAGRKPALAVSLAAAKTSEEQFSLCEAASTEERFVAKVESPALDELVDRYNESSSSPLGISGDDLGVPRGPSIGTVFRETRVALFAGRIDLSEAPAFARETAMKYLKD